MCTCFAHTRMSNSLDLIWERVSVTAEKLLRGLCLHWLGLSSSGPRSWYCCRSSPSAVWTRRDQIEWIDIIYIVWEYPYISSNIYCYGAVFSSHVFPSLRILNEIVLHCPTSMTVVLDSGVQRFHLHRPWPVSLIYIPALQTGDPHSSFSPCLLYLLPSSSKEIEVEQTTTTPLLTSIAN